MLQPGETVPMDASVWTTPQERATLRELVADAPILLLFYLFDWTST